MLELVGVIVGEGRGADQQGRGQGEGGDAGAKPYEGLSVVLKMESLREADMKHKPPLLG
jgi:hypothetical protein